MSVNQTLIAQNLFVPKELFNHQDYLGCYQALSKNHLTYPASVLKLKCLIKLDSFPSALKLVKSLPKNNHDDFEIFGDAYRYSNLNDSALYYYQQAAKISKKETLLKKIQQCFNFKEISKIKSDVTLKNIGSTINKKENQYYPQLKYDSLLFYNDESIDLSERIKCLNLITNQSLKINLILKDKLKDFKDLYIIGASPKSDFILINVLHKSVEFYTLKLCKYNFKENSITEISNLNEQLSKTISEESSANISNDGEQIVFSSNRKGGYGGYDIYMSKILPNGEYSVPKNLGKSVNTEANEEFPLLSFDGKKLFFSSDGHTSIGGYDLFSCEYDSILKTFINVRNFGLPVNTVNDNFNITINSTGRHGYTSGMYKTTTTNYGNTDVYELTFNDIEENNIIMIGKTQNKNITSIEISKTDNNELIGIYKLNHTNGRFIAALTPGNYTIDFLMNDTDIKKQITIPNRPNLSEMIINYDVK